MHVGGFVCSCVLLLSLLLLLHPYRYPCCRCSCRNLCCMALKYVYTRPFVCSTVTQRYGSPQGGRRGTETDEEMEMEGGAEQREAVGKGGGAAASHDARTHSLRSCYTVAAAVTTA
eukprot:GHVU01049613.1.p4 GENE.GHVU01049613.1~~GHVU01049613.1.p4  ORF type:complete len:116 (+),score=18.07 GHVU01049613.1:357-704(+)